MPAAERLALVERAADVAYLAGAGPRSVDLARQAIDGLDASAPPATRAAGYLLLGRNAWAIGDSAAAFDAYRRARALVPVEPASVALARILAEEARGLMLVSRFAEAEERSREALAMAAAVGDRTVEGHALCTLACCRGAAGHFDEGIALGREALAIAEDPADPEALDRAYGNLSHVLMESGRLAECVALVFDNVAAGEELWGARLNGATANGVESLIRLGRFDEATVLLGETSERAAGSCTMARPLLRAMVAIRRGRFEQADGLLARCEELTATFTDVQRRAAFHLLLAELALLQRRAGDAYRDVERALALAAGTDDETFRPEMWAVAVRCLADDVEDGRARGRRIDLDKARLLALGFEHEAMAMAAAPGERGGTCPPRTAAFAATCAAERSRLDESDPERWADAVRRWEAAGEPYQRAYCRWREAEALLERHEARARADECLQEAWQLAAGLGAVPLRGAHRPPRAARPRRPARRRGRHGRIDRGRRPRPHAPRGRGARSARRRAHRPRDRRSALHQQEDRERPRVEPLAEARMSTNRVEAGRIGQAHGCG